VNGHGLQKQTTAVKEKRGGSRERKRARWPDRDGGCETGVVVPERSYRSHTLEKHGVDQGLAAALQTCASRLTKTKWAATNESAPEKLKMKSVVGLLMANPSGKFASILECLAAIPSTVGFEAIGRAGAYSPQSSSSVSGIPSGPGENGSNPLGFLTPGWR